ncbi:hypothetical protein F5X98DRAFT_369924 [Xylaria grammica]|nr:hypothetical protein F5X98DRAFT_369924 [Xylaria grammica]
MALDEETRIGRLWRLGEENVEDMSGGKQDERAAVINGPAWSPNGPYKYGYDIESGTETSGRLFAKLEGGRMPDELAVDVESHVWVVSNSQGKLVRISPDGNMVATCIVPGAKMASCPAFSEKDMKTLFITSIAADRSTGNVYRARVDVPGIHRHQLKL